MNLTRHCGLQELGCIIPHAFEGVRFWRIELREMNRTQGDKKKAKHFEFWLLMQALLSTWMCPVHFVMHISLQASKYRCPWLPVINPKKKTSCKEKDYY